MDKKSLQEQFEALPLMVAILNDSFIYVDQTNEYTHPNLEDNRVTLGYVNGAWYAFQHQQAKVDELQERVDAAELKLKEIANIAMRARRGEYYTESGRNAGLNIAAQIEQALKGGCKHESDGSHLLSKPPKTKCKKCGEIYSADVLKGEG
ncbi:hypothetical protein [Acinetobacter baumannii]|uniref:hypothetical protein n=1 Tax=Acinetobacter baumannii TaxID=470 RepID=UPI00294964AE|nr:hypothetical protein [Acinetobacter baumannii]MDV5702077.1 hypothetical protein [Acinetobacter baumannii]